MDCGSALRFYRVILRWISFSLCMSFFWGSQVLAEDSSWYFSAGLTRMALDSQSDEIVLSDLGDASKLALVAGPIEGSGVSVSGDEQPSLTFGYRFNSMPGLSLESVIAPPFVLDLAFTGTIRDESIAPIALGTLETGIPALGEELGSTKALPAVVTLVYNFNPEGRFQPYVGAGITAIYTFDHKIENAELLRQGSPTMDIDLAIAPILQIGLASRLSNRFSLVTELKSASGISIDGRMKNIALVSPNFSDVIGPATVGTGELSLDVDVTVLNVSIRWDM